MRNKIFTFSGTGNASAISKTLASMLKETECTPMSSVLDGFAGTDEERIGLVFPVYAWGLPRLVAEFARRIRTKSNQYVFAVATCGGSQGNTLKQLSQILEANGSRLDAGFAVRGDFMISLEGSNDLPIIKFVSWLGRKYVPQSASTRINDIIRVISEKTTRSPETSNASVNVVGSLMYRPALRMFKAMDKGYAASDACISCGICAQVCPRENVTLVDHRPTWHRNCEMCYACMVWCPQRAISLQGSVPDEPRHHSDVTLQDALLR